MPWQPALPYNAVICRYNEIATKKRNRGIFEDYLVAALKRALSPIGYMHVERAHGRLFFIPKDKHLLTERDLRILRKNIPHVAGVSSVSPGFLVEPDMEQIHDAVMKAFPAVYQAFITAEPHLEPTYAMRARRANKGFAMTSADIEIQFAHEILKQYPDLKLDLNHANLVIETEIRHHQAFVSFERIQGPGGLPVGSGGKVLALLSGGIDSPVACFQMMRRGCSVDFITFHSSPYTPPEYVAHIADIARILNQYQPAGRLVAVNLLEAQKQVRDFCKSKHRTVLYRRFMLRIAQKVAAILRAKALVTGDNVGQVASQTLENMAVINSATDMLVLRPLLTFEKLETIAIAEEIGTIDLSNKHVPDSCTVFAPDDPATATILPAIVRDEKNLDVDALVQLSLQNSMVVNLDTLEETPVLSLCHAAMDTPEETPEPQPQTSPIDRP